MDSSISAAARALRTGDPLGALKRVGLRDDPPALALRGIDALNVAYQYLDLVPKGRDETGEAMNWLRRRDEYDR